jgi:hypothetical protein
VLDLTKRLLAEATKFNAKKEKKRKAGNHEKPAFYLLPS